MTIRYVKVLDGSYRKYWDEDGKNMVKDIDEDDLEMVQWLSEGNTLRDILKELEQYEAENNLSPE
jgi:hypothetical protein